MSAFGPAFERLLDDLERERERRLREEANRGWRAWMLSTTPEVYTALMRGESVPVDRLDQNWFVRFGGRRRR